MSEQEPIRLAKLIAERGLASRREAERWIAEGRVTVNGQAGGDTWMIRPGKDVVKVDGQRLPPAPDKVYFLLYKPRGCITGRNDAEKRRSVHDLVEHLKVRLEPIGRLDYDTEGALLLTNDGALAHKLTHPSMKVPKRYSVKVHNTPGPEKIRAIEQGKVFLDDGPAQPAKVRLVEGTAANNAWLEITVTEGKNRLVRRIFQQLRHPVAKLRRESFATISIRGMERGQVRPLTAAEVRRVQDLANGVKPKNAGRVRRKTGFAKAKPKTRMVSKKQGGPNKRKKTS